MKSGQDSGRPPADPTSLEYRVAWHEADCGGYRVDLSAWLELAGSQQRDLLDLGSGSGRVAVSLDAAGHRVTALDRDEALLEALRRRRPRVSRVVADARSFELQRNFDLILAPMQLLQLFTGVKERRGCLRSSLRHLAPGGRFACALVDIDRDSLPVGRDLLADRELSPDIYEFRPGLWATSTPRRFELSAEGLLTIERRREIRVVTREDTGERVLCSTLSIQRLALLDASEIESELESAGLRPVARRQVPATDLHMGSVIVVAEAA